MGGLGSVRNTLHKTHFRITHTVHHKHTPHVHECNMFHTRYKDVFIHKLPTKGKEKRLLLTCQCIQTAPDCPHLSVLTTYTHTHICILRTQD